MDKKPNNRGKHEAWINGRRPFKGPGPGRPKGSKNKSTYVNMAMDAIARDKKGVKSDPLNPDNTAPVDYEYMMVARQIMKALSGDLGAFKELMDIRYGKNPDIVIGDPEKPIEHNVNHDGKVEVELTGAALLEELKRRGLPTKVLEE